LGNIVRAYALLAFSAAGTGVEPVSRGFVTLLTLLSLLLATSPGKAIAQNPQIETDIPSQFAFGIAGSDFQRTDAMIPMRDGVKLNTIILTPKSSQLPAPIVLTRTPYSASRRVTERVNASTHLAAMLGADDELLVREGYIRVFQDVRGKYRSEGNFIMTAPIVGPLNSGHVDESTDAWDTIDWLVKNVKGNNGSVGMTGVSYAGFLTLMALVDPHPALKVAVPVNPMVDAWVGDDLFHNGAFRLVDVDYLYRQMGTRDSEIHFPYSAYDMYTFFLSVGTLGNLDQMYGLSRLPFWQRVIGNPSYTPYWRLQAVDRVLRERATSVPTLIVHGLFDQEDIYGPLAAYTALDEKDTTRDHVFLVIGPWYHNQTHLEGSARGSAIGQINWRSDTVGFFRERILQPFYDYYLKGISSGRPTSRVLAFETGSNEWRDYETWPPRDTTVIEKAYLHSNSHLSFEPPEASDVSFDEYVSDPAKPVPYRVRPIPAEDLEGWQTWLAGDQRPFSDRPDAVTYVTGPLEHGVTVSGQVTADVYAATSGTDADWVVKLIDVYPDEVPSQPELGGYELMISGDIFRGRYWKSLEHATAISPNRIQRYRIRLPQVNHTFLPGHRIMVQVQSSWFPLYDRNPQKYVPNVFRAAEADFVRATQRIYHGGHTASCVELPVHRSH
jgi:putative CocE/NonD family hydrolase